jgi:hypothetical protein
MYSLISEY